MFYVTYAFSELRRRSGRTILTALGLALGVGLVVTVTALSKGLDEAQAEVLKPLTGVGTDMTVTRPISFARDGNGFPQLSEQERQQLQEENGPRRFAPRGASKSAARAGVGGAAGGLTLNAIHIEGTVPEESAQPQQGGGFVGPGGGQQGFGPRNIDVHARSARTGERP